jgi:hypothetical protein
MSITSVFSEKFSIFFSFFVFLLAFFLLATWIQRIFCQVSQNRWFDPKWRIKIRFFSSTLRVFRFWYIHFLYGWIRRTHGSDIGLAGCFDKHWPLQPLHMRKQWNRKKGKKTPNYLFEFKNVSFTISSTQSPRFCLTIKKCCANNISLKYFFNLLAKKNQRIDQQNILTIQVYLTSHLKP